MADSANRGMLIQLFWLNFCGYVHVVLYPVLNIIVGLIYVLVIIYFWFKGCGN